MFVFRPTPPTPPRGHDAGPPPGPPRSGAEPHFVFRPPPPADVRDDDDGVPPGSLLAPALYARMRRAFGGVRVGNHGEPLSWRPLVAPGDRQRARIESPGEVYRFCCPYCGDARFRGWAGHAFGQPDPVTGVPMHGLVGCFNEGCFSGPDHRGNRDEFLLRVLGVLGPRYTPPPCEPGRAAGPPGPVSLPGTTVSLLELKDDHPARAYLRARGFDPGELAARYGLGYCLDAGDDATYAIGRLIVPVRMDGRLVGWQARKLHEAGPNAKYYNSRGPKASAIYGWDEAEGGRLAVLVEGAASVWALGPPAMAPLGSALGPQQCDRLAAIGARGGLAVVLFDPGAEEKAARAAEALRRHFAGRVVFAALPGAVAPEECRRWPIPKLDPGELTREAGWRIIAGAVAAAGFRLGDYWPAGASTA